MPVGLGRAELLLRRPFILGVAGNNGATPETANRDGRAPRQSPSWWPCAMVAIRKDPMAVWGGRTGRGRRVAERRQRVAHGASRGLNEQNESSPGWGERSFRRLVFCRPIRGLNGIDGQTHGFTVGYYLPRLTARGAARRRKRPPGRARSPATSQLVAVRLMAVCKDPANGGLGWTNGAKGERIRETCPLVEIL